MLSHKSGDFPKYFSFAVALVILKFSEARKVQTFSLQVIDRGYRLTPDVTFILGSGCTSFPNLVKLRIAVHRCFALTFTFNARWHFTHPLKVSCILSVSAFARICQHGLNWVCGLAIVCSFCFFVSKIMGDGTLTLYHLHQIYTWYLLTFAVVTKYIVIKLSTGCCWVCLNTR